MHFNIKAQIESNVMWFALYKNWGIPYAHISTQQTTSNISQVY